MTIHYNHALSTATYASLLRMAVRWKGSLWKTVYQDLFIWCILYALISVTYRCWLNESQRRTFERVVKTMQDFENFFPLTFMLGFYVTLVCGRWWSMIMSIGLIDNLALTVANYMRGLDQRTIRYKRAIVRYMCLLQVMVYRSVSTSCKKKYPTLKSIADAGYLEPNELSQFSEDNFWMSVHWALSLTIKAREEGLIKSDYFVKHIIETCISFRTSQITLWIYSWIPVPLVYTQVVFMTVRLYFLVAVVSRQYVLGSSEKVAEALLNPFGDDEDDFDAAWFLDRNLNKAQAILDNNVHEPPPLCDDKFSNLNQKKSPRSSSDESAIATNEVCLEAT
ncbi:unnamed protein product [Enterobius vermicularis]|uniref:Bestrophin homolog n=1 Tax=Enterobius vermicularis TaxID=51028 RepID=A0A158QB60_ENTVE|nr:unnamed protein product [Enterobius vermicularis]